MNYFHTSSLGGGPFGGATPKRFWFSGLTCVITSMAFFKSKTVASNSPISIYFVK